MKCEQYEELFAGWINNELLRLTRKGWKQHLNTCPACRVELASMQADLGLMDEVEVPSRGKYAG